ncbi:hypothetical protein GRF61_07315 [Azoarcus sp. TTM-91]|uniref:EF-hand domain-containing protein n=1 Tax=Azoarcus sp. TTM-91 TaxID=2691581 RepID=UPI00145DFDBD|nr:EF-hand domain-containing protein [Azoarcus sp. TTM-91]NMG34253.1 hypothetical protein [Azoarcus sp. TTM-91]
MKNPARLLPLLLIGICAPVLAQSASPGQGPQGERGGERGGNRIAQLDKNGDGFLSKDEVKDNPRLLERFSTLDTNKDGRLSQEELRAGMRPPEGRERGERPDR